MKKKGEQPTTWVNKDNTAHVETKEHEIWGFYSSENTDCGVLGCDTSLADGYQRLRGAYHLHVLGRTLPQNVGNTFLLNLGNTYKITWCHNLEKHKL
jgi:hypothetical protein